jgi:hypothetical protein
MFGLGAATRIYVAVGPTDMRKSFEGLFGLVKVSVYDLPAIDIGRNC